MPLNEMSARDTFFARSGQWEWPHAGVGIQNVASREISLWEQPVCLTKKVIDFPLFSPHSIRIGVKLGVSGTNQVVAVPGNYKERSAVRVGFRIDGHRSSARKRWNNEVTSFSSAN